MIHLQIRYKKQEDLKMNNQKKILKVYEKVYRLLKNIINIYY